MPELNDILTTRLAENQAKGLTRRLVPTKPLGAMQILRAGKTLLNFSSNDYLGLSRDARVIRASNEAALVYGAGSTASRLVCGNHPAYAPLETALAVHKNTESSLVVGSGYLANSGVIPALMGKGDLVLGDKLMHACMVDGAQLSGASFKRFSHNDMQHLEQLLAAHRGAHKNCLVLTESVFSMDGDAAPLEALSVLCKRYDAWLLVDDAHGLYDAPAPDGVDIWVGTLSKALGAYGGYIAGSEVLATYLVNHMRSAIFSTALPASTLAAAHAALEIATREPEHAARARAHAARFAKAFEADAPASAIVPLVVGQAKDALAASQVLEEAGFFVSAIRPPTVPPGTSRLRVTFSAAHDEADVKRLIATIKTLDIRPL